MKTKMKTKRVVAPYGPKMKNGLRPSGPGSMLLDFRVALWKISSVKKAAFEDAQDVAAENLFGGQKRGKIFQWGINRVA